MLKLHYAGPKPEISQHGIFFRNGKEDKYLYLELATKILLAIDKDYQVQKSHLTQIDNNNKLSDMEILEILKSYIPDLYQKVEEEENRYEAHIEKDMIEHVKLLGISDEDKNVWISNINIMKPYMIQREINKLYYIECIKEIKYLIAKDKIKEIDMLFSLKNWHILESIAGNLSNGVKSVATEIKVQQKDDELVTQLFINA